MNIFSRIFKKKTNSTTYLEKDNLGTRHFDVGQASAYWLARNISQQHDPFVVYSFDSEQSAREALLELPCIHQAQDTGKLICTEVLIFGYYANKEGKYEAIICGKDLSHDLWALTKESFIRHGGKPTGQGDLEPEIAPAKQLLNKQTPKPDKVKFVQEEEKVQFGKTFVYRVYKAPDAASAQAFLQNNPVDRQFLYLVVETPEGNYCRDIQGIYQE